MDDTKDPSASPAVETIDDVERELASVDRGIIAALARRQELVERAAAFSRSADEIVDPVPHACLLTRVQRWAGQAGLSPVLAQAVYLAILDDAIARQLELVARRERGSGSAAATPRVGVPSS